MSRTLPTSELDVDAIVTVDEQRRRRWRDTAKLAPPRWRSPPGVILRLLGEGESNPVPVLVCGVCNRPQLHQRRGDHAASCITCGKERPW